MRRLNDLYSATPVYPGQLLSVAVFQHLDLLRERARSIVEADRKLLRDFLVKQSGILAVSTDWGTTSFPQLVAGNADDFLERLRTKFDTSAVPGRFFEMPDHFRIGMGVNTEMFAEGLNRISRRVGVRFCSQLSFSCFRLVGTARCAVRTPQRGRPYHKKVTRAVAGLAEALVAG